MFGRAPGLGGSRLILPPPESRLSKKRPQAKKAWGLYVERPFGGVWGEPPDVLQAINTLDCAWFLGSRRKNEK
jgi:hypothetical protein